MARIDAIPLGRRQVDRLPDAMAAGDRVASALSSATPWTSAPTLQSAPPGLPHQAPLVEPVYETAGKAASD